MPNWPKIVKRLVPCVIGCLALVFLAAGVWAAEPSVSPLQTEAVADLPPPDQVALINTPFSGVLNAEQVNIRNGPDLSAPIIGRPLAKGTVLAVLDRSGDWVKVSSHEVSGWVHGDFVAPRKAALVVAQNQPAPAPETRQAVDSPAPAPKAPLQEQPQAVGVAPPGTEQQPAEGLYDLIKVYQLAQKHDPAFQSERYRHAAKAESLQQAYAALLPNVNADLTYQQSHQKILNTSVAVFGDDNADFPSTVYNLTLRQPLFRYASFVRVDQAQEEVRGADFEFEAARQNLILRVAEAYIAVLEAHQNLEFLRTEEEALKQHFELARERFHSGLAPITDFHDAKARFAYVTARRVKAENDLEDAHEALAAIAGRRIEAFAKLKYARLGVEEPGQETAGTGDSKASPAGQASAVLPMTGPDPDEINDWIDAAFKQNLDILVRQQAMRVAWHEIDRQKGAYWPTLDLMGRMNRDDEGGSLFGGESDVVKNEVILQLNVPLFEGGMVSSKTREALELYKASEQELEKQVRLAKRETKAAFLGVKGAIENTEALRQSVVSTQIALKAKREGFRSGLFPSLVVLDAERDLYSAKLEYVKAQYEYLLNSLRLKKAVGTLSSEDLAGINQWLE